MRNHACLFALALACLVAPPATQAALGGPEAQAAADAAALRTTPLQRPAGAYTVHEFVAPGGTRIREFAVPGGAVFAVSWNGPFRPDLRTLLGERYADYQSAPRLAGSTRSQLAIDHAGLRVRSGGHMHAFRGIAWLPSLLPLGLEPGALQ